MNKVAVLLVNLNPQQPGYPRFRRLSENAATGQLFPRFQAGTKENRKDEVKTRTTRSRSRTTRSRTVDEDIRYMRFPKGPNSVSLG
ncbi:hypothetical protein T4D_7880 [Trichinella pseudospiralis]|uniref:Uncharacterized protein n=1 Tax=Trichinella pseudospiralis TaxID=6337 RepID=A0A0V1FRJ2_TRIPS|nr:hypothetical protein T4D_7880 [Trichinella pseudospiralis]